MRVGLLYKPMDRPWGGVNSFFRNFKRFGERSHGIEITADLKNADVVLSPGHFCGPGRLIKKRQLRNIKCGRSMWNLLAWPAGSNRKRIVFRLDGLRAVYAGTWTRADRVLIENMALADSAVFQSRFSRSCFDQLGILYPPNPATVHNGADVGIFFPADKPPASGRNVTLISNSWSTNERKGFETIARFSDLKNVTVLHIGRWPDRFPIKAVKVLGAIREAAR